MGTPRRRRSNRKRNLRFEQCEARNLLAAALSSNTPVDVSNGFYSNYETPDLTCWQAHIQSADGFNTQIPCDGFVSIGKGPGIQLVRTEHARSGNHALQITYQANDGLGQAVLPIVGTDYVRTTQHMRFNASHDFAFGQDLQRIYSVDADEEVYFSMVVSAWGKPLEGYGSYDMTGMNDMRYLSINYNGSRNPRLEWGSVWNDDFGFERERWYKITTEVQLNRVGYSDGWVRVSVDDVVVAEKYEIEIRDSSDHQVNRLLFGGAWSNSVAGENPALDPATPTSVLIDDVAVSIDPTANVPDLKPPQIVEPSQVTSVTQPQIRWLPEELTDDYEYRVLRVNDGLQIAEGVSHETSLRLPFALANGDYQVDVRSRHSGAVSAWSSHSFAIRQLTRERVVIFQEDFEQGNADQFDEISESGATWRVTQDDSFAGGNRSLKIRYGADRDEIEVKAAIYDLAGKAGLEQEQVETIDVRFASRLPEGLPIDNLSSGWGGLKLFRAFNSEGEIDGIQDQLTKYNAGSFDVSNPPTDQFDYVNVVGIDHRGFIASLDIDVTEWFTIRHFAKRNTPGEADGVYMVWVNDRLVGEAQNVSWTDDPAKWIDGIWWGGNLSLQGGLADKPFTRLIDNIFVAVNGEVDHPDGDPSPPNPGDPDASTDKLVALDLVATDLAGNPITEIQQHEQFFLDVYAEDLRSQGAGVFSAFLDIEFNPVFVEISDSITFGPIYTGFQTGDFSVPGQLDEVGAAASSAIAISGRNLLLRIPMRAVAAGTVEFVSSQADVLPAHEVTIFGFDEAVPVNRVRYGAYDLLVHPVTPWHNPNLAWDVNNDGHVSPLDALFVLNFLSRHGHQSVKDLPNPTHYFLDTNNDGYIAPLDALLVLNELSRRSRVILPTAEGAAPPEVEKRNRWSDLADDFFRNWYPLDGLD